MTWLSIHFYPLDTENVFLSRAVRPFLEQHIWPISGARAFFIRYDDDKGRHIRLRMRGESDWVESTLRPAFQQWFDGKGTWEEVPYLAETERFGGPEAIAWAEEYFHISTRVVLDRLQQETFTYGDALYDALRMHVITAFAAGFNREKTVWYFSRLCDQWLEMFFPAEENKEAGAANTDSWKAQFATSLAPQKETLQATLGGLLKALQDEKFDKKQREWVRWLRGNQLVLNEFGDNLDKVLPSLLHLTNNRLGVNNQDEVYLNYILANAV